MNPDIQGANDGPGDAREGTTESTPIRIECKPDAVDLGLDVSWTRGAIFEFDSEEAATLWVEDENFQVPGQLFLAEANGTSNGLLVDYHLKYSSPDQG